MRTLLLVDGAEEVTAAIAYYLRGEFSVSVCHDGEKALRLLQSQRPDILVMNLMLPYMDGLTMLQESAYCPPVVLAWSYFVNDYVAERALAVGVNMLLITPSPRTVAVRLMDLLNGCPAEEKPATPEAKVALQLHLLGFAGGRDGYRQLCVGIPLFCEDPQQNLSKELYPAIARLCDGKTEKCVEHSIRNAIEHAWKHRKGTAWERAFPGTERCPTNKTFIARIAEIIKL